MDIAISLRLVLCILGGMHNSAQAQARQAPLCLGDGISWHVLIVIVMLRLLC